MITYVKIILVAAVLSRSAPTLAQVDSDWTTTPFVTCMKQACPAYPDGVCSQDIVLNCHNSASGSSKEKRDTADVISSSANSLVLRDGGLTGDANPDCSASSLPKNFMVVTDIRAGAHDWCQTMKTDLLTKGVGYISQNLSTAVTKTADELHGNKAVLLSLVLSAYPPGLAAFKTLQATDTILTDGCTDALTKLATKGSGCTKDLNWYNAGSAKGETSTGALPGTINIAKNAVDWMFLTAEYLKPSAIA